LENKEREEEIG